MDFAILRVEKLKTFGNIAASLMHNYRLRPTPNADPARLGDNEHDLKTAQQVMNGIKNRLPEKTRKNAVLAIEYLITASPDWHGWKWTNKEKDKEFFDKAKEWLIKKHGAENVISATIHRDETTPHMAVYVVPIDSHGNLNCRAFLGGKGKLSEMQTSFYNDVKHLGLSRGIEGSKAEHQPMQKRYAELQRPTEKTYLEKNQIKSISLDDFGFVWTDNKAAKNDKLQKYFASIFDEQHKYYQEQSLKVQEALSIKLSDQISKTEHAENAHKNALNKIKSLEKKIDKMLDEFSQIIEFKELFPNDYKKIENDLKNGIENHKNKLLRIREEDARFEAQLRANRENEARILEQQKAEQLKSTLLDDRKMRIDADREHLRSIVGECITEPEKLAYTAIQSKLEGVVREASNNYIGLIANNEPETNPYAEILRIVNNSEEFDFKKKLDIILNQCEVSRNNDYDDSYRGWGVRPSYYDNFDLSAKYIVAIQELIDFEIKNGEASLYEKATEAKIALSDVLVGKCKKEYDVLLSYEHDNERRRKYDEYVELSNKKQIDKGSYFEQEKKNRNDFEM